MHIKVVAHLTLGRALQGATVVDFAYHVHTDVGNLMVGAKVNGKMVPSDHQLRNAEVVEITTYSTDICAQDVLRHMVRPLLAQQWHGPPAGEDLPPKSSSDMFFIYE